MITTDQSQYFTESQMNCLLTMISSDLQLKMASLVINNLRMLGTRPPQSTLGKLLIDLGEKVVCTFLDLRKAFDVIEHATLIS